MRKQLDFNINRERKEVFAIINYLEERLREHVGYETAITMDLVEELVIRAVTYRHFSRHKLTDVILPGKLSYMEACPVPENLMDSIALEVVEKFFGERDNYLTKHEFPVILGLIHECFLEKKNQRKPTGIYYTPEPVVHYMVNRTLQAFFADLLNKIRKDRADYRILQEHLTKLKNHAVIDPACGSGAFLVYIFRQYLKFYQQLGEIFSSATPLSGEVRQGNVVVPENLSSHIMDNHIRGIDVDPDAVRLTRLALYYYGINHCAGDFKGFLKSLEVAVQWSNTLEISPERRVKYDLVIGNPPYIANKSIPAGLKKNIKELFPTATSQFDSIVPFMEFGIKSLKPGGILSYIVSNKFMVADYGIELRRLMLKETTLKKLVDVSSQKIFADASIYPVILILENRAPGKNSVVTIIDGIVLPGKNKIEEQNPNTIPQDFFLNLGPSLISTGISRGILPVIEKINAWPGRLNTKDIHCGIATAGFGKHITSEPDKKTEWFRILLAGDINNYRVKETEKFISAVHVSKQQNKLFREIKLVVPGIARRLKAAIDFQGRAAGRVYFIPLAGNGYNVDKLYYLLALLNSSVLEFYYRVLYWPVHLAGGYMRINSTYLVTLPIPYWETGEPERRPDVRKVIDMAKEITQCADDKLTALASELDRYVFGIYGLDHMDAQKILNFLEATAGRRSQKFTRGD
ncbi:Eco57I restriction-modification methylase domain-containing protein [Thermincola potens]|uniref:site-specific DNA-methyltransferase (adenine-specific) n=1 Tax=Thermincola potens (strain JR) TaxID=635013 RepID=D5XEX3_THEPJ|nr:N-6 DNA methylase [Thermincola potens]ADG82194.1 putative RNA methylase [Thermincola potens JR]